MECKPKYGMMTTTTKQFSDKSRLVYHTFSLKQMRPLTVGVRGFRNVCLLGYNDYKRLFEHVNTTSDELESWPKLYHQ